MVDMEKIVNFITEHCDTILKESMLDNIVHVLDRDGKIITKETFQKDSDEFKTLVLDTIHRDMTLSILINGTMVFSGLMTDETAKHIRESKEMTLLRDRWVKVGTPKESVQLYCQDEFIMYIIEGGHRDMKLYTIVHESAYDPIGHKVETLTASEILEKYNIVV